MPDTFSKFATETIKLLILQGPPSQEMAVLGLITFLLFICNISLLGIIKATLPCLCGVVINLKKCVGIAILISPIFPNDFVATANKCYRQDLLLKYLDNLDNFQFDQYN